VVIPCHQYRHNPAWIKVRDWLREGAIGRWHLAEFAVYREAADRGAGGSSGAPWRAQRGAARGGVLLDHGTHIIYQLLDVAGPPSSVYGWTGRLAHVDYDVEDTAHVLLAYPGRLATVFLTWAGRRRENRIRFVGDAGTIEWREGELCLERAGDMQRLDFTRELDKASYWRWYACLFQEFVTAMEEGTGERYLEDIAQVAGVLERAYASAAP
jgi:predicted dehydrogenase